ncbi:LHFPL tetraspan subfamily member 3 protein-like isoform X1 [Ruditapes philippinarum]|uniref:LHFPL tetraspan subfamily member 3 protein-like isoform X1 n=1 Tax=Ruditapes philippinarum TaxID=129788 RepID=UPI00295BB6D2|nr:LHFPL tetraspan subfamily member 3 protein-like isoform X1 [Ruditapes philippinarum]
MTLQRYDRESLFFFAYHFNKNHRAIAVAWAVMSIVFCVLVCIAFSQPQWIGDTEDSPGYGHFGVYQYCVPDNIDATYTCTGSFTTFDTILNDEFKATTVFMGISALFMLIVVGALVMFFCFKKGYVFVICGALEIITAIFMFLACVIYPSGWENNQLQTICGESSGKYRMGDCNIRWAYILAILGIFDAAILAILAFFLASKRAKIEMYTSSGAVTKSELNGFGAETMSKRSLAIQPTVVAVPSVQHEGRESYSEYSQVQKRAGSGFNL